MILDVQGAFLHAMASGPVLMKLRGPLVEVMVMTDPALCRDFVTTDKKGEPLLYVHTNKALYGLLKSALDLYNKLRTDLEQVGAKSTHMTLVLQINWQMESKRRSFGMWMT